MKIKANFFDNADEADFYYQKDEKWIKLGITQKLYFRLDHFVGCRVGLFLFSTKEVDGVADFEHFVYKCVKGTGLLTWSRLCCNR